MYRICTVSSSNAVHHISGVGIYAGNAAPQFDDRPIANNGLILSGSNGTTVNFVSNTSSNSGGVGVITVPDGYVLSVIGRISVWLVYNPYGRPGELRLESSSLLPTRTQGIYTGTIYDSNRKIFVFNVGLYPTGFNGISLLLVVFSFPDTYV